LAQDLGDQGGRRTKKKKIQAGATSQSEARQITTRGTLVFEQSRQDELSPKLTLALKRGGTSQPVGGRGEFGHITGIGKVPD